MNISKPEVWVLDLFRNGPKLLQVWRNDLTQHKEEMFKTCITASVLGNLKVCVCVCTRVCDVCMHLHLAVSSKRIAPLLLLFICWRILYVLYVSLHRKSEVFLVFYMVYVQKGSKRVISHMKVDQCLSRRFLSILNRISGNIDPVFPSPHASGHWQMFYLYFDVFQLVCQLDLFMLFFPAFFLLLSAVLVTSYNCLLLHLVNRHYFWLVAAIRAAIWSPTGSCLCCSQWYLHKTIHSTARRFLYIFSTTYLCCARLHLTFWKGFPFPLLVIIHFAQSAQHWVEVSSEGGVFMSWHQWHLSLSMASTLGIWWLVRHMS